MSDYTPSTAYGGYYPPADGHNQQPHLAQSYDLSMSAYHYNHALPNYNPAMVPPGVTSIPSYQTWNPDAYEPPANSHMQQSNPQWTDTGYGNSAYSAAQPHVPYHAPYNQQHHLYQPALQAIQGDARSLSRGEFDGQNGAFNTSKGPYSVNQYRTANELGYSENPHRTVYGNQNNYRPSQESSTAEGLKHSQETQIVQPQAFSQSSHSLPHLSMQPKADRLQHDKAHEPAMASVSKYTYSHGVPHDTPTKSTGASEPRVGQTGEEPRRFEVPETLLGSGKISHRSSNDFVVEARKKAEGAVLDLWSYEISLPSYAAAGLDQTLVESLFDSLKLPKTQSKPNEDQNVTDTPKASGRTEARNILQEVSNNAFDTLTDNKTIQQPPAASVFTEQPLNVPKINDQSSQVLADAQKKSEQQKALQMKIEALKKSREERAQKAAKSRLLSPMNTSSAQKENVKPQDEAEVKHLPTGSHSKQHPPPPPNPPRLEDPGPSTKLPLITTTTPAIPGLFRSASSVSTPRTTVASNMMDGSPLQARKRPVAADLYSPPSESTTKRPFGHSRGEQALVIDVSEDEEDVAMDLDSQCDVPSPADLIRNLSDQTPASFGRSKPDNTQKLFPYPATAGTPPFASKAGQGNIQEKQIAIEVMKKKIAEMEKRKKDKFDRRGSSGAQTPHTTESGSVEQTQLSSPVNDPPPTKVRSRLGLEHRLATEREALAQSQLEQANLYASNQDEIEQRRARREKIASILPLVDQEIEQKRLKVDELSKETAQVEAAIQKHLAHKRLLDREMEKLAREMADHSKEADLSKLTEQVNFSCEDSMPPPFGPSMEKNKAAISEIFLDESRKSSMSMELDTPLQPGSMTPFQHQVFDISKECIRVDENLNISRTNVPALAANTPQQKPDSVQQKTTRGEDGAHEQNKVTTVDTAKSHSLPEPEAAASSPEEGEATPDGGLATSSEYSPATGRDALDKSEVESDIYEPPGATPPTEETPREASSPLNLFTPDAVDKATAPIVAEKITQMLHATDEPELTVSKQVQLRRAYNQNQEEVAGQASLSGVMRYAPYESPLAIFRAFRYHPEYSRNIPGGQRSLTYANKIDPKKAICRYELAGGVCNDKTCDFQHFETMRVSDDEILSILGNPNEFTGEHRERFVASLRVLLGALRSRGVRDFEVIANEIVTHRAKFLGDRSKILNLNGISI